MTARISQCTVLALTGCCLIVPLSMWPHKRLDLSAAVSRWIVVRRLDTDSKV